MERNEKQQKENQTKQSEMKWTEEQQQVIHLRNRNLLVSAAAGSGKTAVLVERIIQKITAKENPTDIDRLLVVTFTKAAAAEMRERIGTAIEKKLEENPQDENLKKQQTLLHNAQITTIDSFCLFVVRNYFEEIDLEPNFRIADQGEIKLLEMDVLNNVFETEYAKALQAKEEYESRIKNEVASIHEQTIKTDYESSLSENQKQLNLNSNYLQLQKLEINEKDSGNLENSLTANVKKEELSEGSLLINLQKGDTDSEVCQGTFYAKKQEDYEGQFFLQFADAYSGKRNNKAVKEMVLKIYHQSASNPWPKEWIKDLSKLYEAETKEELLQTDLMCGICAYVKTMLQECKSKLKSLKEVALLSDGPTKYAETLEKDLALFENIDTLQTFEQLEQFFKGIKFSTLGAIRKFEGDIQKKEAVSAGRDEVKKEVKNMTNRYFSLSLEELLNQLKGMRQNACELVRVSLLFYEAMEQEKKKKHIMDFSDVEHFALRIFIDEKTKQIRPVANEFRQQFEEIMIDEYQDSNQVQEEIMCAISNGRNMFMVGDVKQSIYRFRLARPELFMEKYNKFTLTESENMRIDLHKNFRSRQDVVDFSNDIFYKIMQTDLGNVAYDESAELKYGASYEETSNMQAEVMFFNMEETGEELDDFSNRQLEARMVAEKIKELKETLLITDKKTKELRPLQYSDIVILFRSLKNWGDDFVSVLENCGVPAHVATSTGYFSATEVQTVLALLQILDNPYQDIPMAAVLKSPIVGLDDEELAEIAVFAQEYEHRTSDEVTCVHEQVVNMDDEYSIYGSSMKEQEFVSSINALKENLVGETILKEPNMSGTDAIQQLPLFNNEKVLLSKEVKREKEVKQEKEVKSEKEVKQEKEVKLEKKKLSFSQAAFKMMEQAEEGKLYEFYRSYCAIRERTKDTPIHELIEYALEKTGYGNFVQALPAGTQRNANLNMLLEKAIAYEKTSYKGLFHFVRYIEQLQKYDVDFGEADVTGENEDVVRIMTIHKSKGLEFPVVFVSGISKQFNEMDIRDKVVVHPDMGLGIDEIRTKPRVKRNCLIKMEIAERIRRDNLGEELRILYVALTRAKEKLILTGTIKKQDAIYKKHTGMAKKGVPITLAQRMKAKSYQNWIIPAVLSYPNKYDFTIVNAFMLASDEIKNATEKECSKNQLLEKIKEADETMVQQFQSEFAYQYPYQQEMNKKSKYSVSELKRASMVEKYDQMEGMTESAEFVLEEREIYVPEFARKSIVDNEIEDNTKDGIDDTRTFELESVTNDEDKKLQIAKNEVVDIQAQVENRDCASSIYAKHMTSNQKTQEVKLIDGNRNIKDTEIEKTQEEIQHHTQLVDTRSKGALRGTAMHRVMQCLDFKAFAKLTSKNYKQIKEFVATELTRMKKQKLITLEMAELVNTYAIVKFLQTETAFRMANAVERGDLFIEKPFVMDYEGVLVQGMMDVFWLENDTVVLLDYKTDYVTEAEELIERYQTQLQLYGDALKRIFSVGEKQVKVECFVYSFRLQDIVQVL